MKNLGGLTKAIFTNQLSATIVVFLCEKGFIPEDREILNKAIGDLSIELRKGINLPDFNVELVVTDKEDQMVVG